jgi:hypothetical protein
MGTGKTEVSQLPKKDSGFVKPVNGVLPKTEYHKLSHGIWCQDEGHLGSAANLHKKTEICRQCKENGPNQTHRRHVWNCPPMKYIRSSANCFVVALATRSSGGRAIPDKVFNNLRKCVHDNFE